MAHIKLISKLLNSTIGDPVYSVKNIENTHDYSESDIKGCVTFNKKMQFF